MDNSINYKKQMDSFVSNSSIGFIAGCWDLFHAGHVLSLREAKYHCEYLIVGLHVNPAKERPSKNTPVQSLYERFIQLHSCEYVDSILPYETEEELEQILKSQPIKIRFLGSDYLGKENLITGYNIVPIHYIPRNHKYSSSELRERIKLSNS